MDDVQIVSNDMTVYEQSIRAEVDIQVSTAKKYPRDLEKFLKNSTFAATHTEASALKCCYTLPRGDKKIQGVSVHLARILAQNFGNIRVAAKGLSVSDTYVTAEAVCMDLETNTAVRVETRQKILDKHGKRYNDDMINITMLACIAKAERNAILHVIPASFTDEVYLAAQKKLVGDIKNDAKKLADSRTKAVKLFSEKYNVAEEMILKYFGKQKLTQLDAEDVVTLRGIYQGLEDGDVTVDATFTDSENPDGEAAKAKAERFEAEEKQPDPQPEKKVAEPAPGELFDRKQPTV